MRAFRKRGITTRVGVKVLGRTDAGDAVGVRIDGGQGEEVVEADAVVVSVGRRPRSESVGFEHVGVEVDERGFVKVDPLLRTTVPGVYALGDLVATPQLAHVAFADILDGRASEPAIAGFLVALAERGETSLEIAEAARALRERLIPIAAPAGAIDVCGTGGDGHHTLNVSTAVALVVAAAGVPVAKHGNRAASS